MSERKIGRDECRLEGQLLVPCTPLDRATEYQGHYRKGLSIMPITNRQLERIKDYVIVKGGDYKKDGIVCNYCPFCGKSVYDRNAS